MSRLRSIKNGIGSAFSLRGEESAPYGLPAIAAGSLPRLVEAVLAMLRDLIYGIRALRRAAAFTIVAVVTIALGIAGNTAIFSAIDQQVLRSLPVSNPEQLVE